MMAGQELPWDWQRDDIDLERAHGGELVAVIAAWAIILVALIAFTVGLGFFAYRLAALLVEVAS